MVMPLVSMLQQNITTDEDETFVQVFLSPAATTCLRVDKDRFTHLKTKLYHTIPYHISV